MRRFAGVVTALMTAWTVCTAGHANAQSYPSKPIRYILPVPAGGPNDYLARLFAERLQRTMGQPLVVENRPGASWIIGTEYVARQPADGYTLLHVAATIVLNPFFIRNVPYDPLRDFAPVTQAVSTTFMLTVHTDLGVKDVKQFIALARAHPGKFTYATVGVGSSHHLAAEQFKSMAGVDLLHVPYKGGAQITQALLSREVDSTFISLFPVRKLVTAGKLIGLGVTPKVRSPLLPDVPTLAEAAGLPDYEMDVWQGVSVRAGTPREIIARLNREIVAVLKDPKDAAMLRDRGLDPVGSTPEEFAQLIKTDMARWGKVIRAAGIEPK